MLVSLRATLIALAFAVNIAAGNEVHELNAKDARNAPKLAETSAGCTKTVILTPRLNLSPTETVWTKTKTTTDKVDCGSCKAVTTSVRHLGPGPVVHITTTVTPKQATTVTAYACKK